MRSRTEINDILNKGTHSGLMWVNVEYMNKLFCDSGESKGKLGEELGYSRQYFYSVEKSGRMPILVARWLCLRLNGDFKELEKRTEKAPNSAKQTPPVGGGVTSDELKELTELVVSYIQDVGKIQTDVVRELREMNAMQKEQLEKMNKTLHELDVFLRNADAENRGFHRGMNNYMQGISTCMRVK